MTRVGIVAANEPTAPHIEQPPSEGLSDLQQLRLAVRRPDIVRARARLYRAAGSPDEGRQLLETAIRQDGWTRQGLWWELVALIEQPQHYTQIRALWLSSPKSCHRKSSILRAVARAASVTGHHDESRALLRRMILLAAEKTKKQRFRAVASLHERARRFLERIQDGVPEDEARSDFTTAAGEALIDLNRALDRLAVRGFLISGTLLGFVRDQGIIGWDKDIDIGVFSESCPPDLEAALQEHSTFRIGRVDLTSDRLRLVHRNGTWIDLFPHYMEGGLRWHDGTATRWWNTPFDLKPIEFLGVRQYVPHDPERYLDENYGDWRVPEPNFDARIDAPNAEIIDEDHFATLLYFALEQSIRKHKKVMQSRYIRMLRDRGEGAWLDRV